MQVAVAVAFTTQPMVALVALVAVAQQVIHQAVQEQQDQ
jgi:hypothetical protein